MHVYLSLPGSPSLLSLQEWNSIALLLIKGTAITLMIAPLREQWASNAGGRSLSSTLCLWVSKLRKKICLCNGTFESSQMTPGARRRIVEDIVYAPAGGWSIEEYWKGMLLVTVISAPFFHCESSFRSGYENIRRKKWKRTLQTWQIGTKGVNK